MNDQSTYSRPGRLGRITTLMAATAILISCGAAAAATLPATPLTLPLVLLRAKGGDTVVLNGEFGDIGIKDRKFSPALKLDLSHAKLSRLAIAGSSGVHVTQGEWSASDVREMVLIDSSDDVSFDGSTMKAEGKSFGFRIIDSSNVTLHKNHIERVFQGINSGRVKNAAYTDNTIIATFNDSIVIYANEGLKIERNEISGNERVDTRHPDGIQFIYKEGDARHGARSSDVVIRDNTISGATQGIFGGGVDRAEITGNTVTIDHGNAIRVGCTDCRVMNNRVATLPGSERRASITLGETTLRCGNRVEAGAGKGSVIDPPCR